MIEALGWVTLALGGGYLLFCAGMMIGTGLGMGGLETVPRGLALGAVLVAVWVPLVVWWSPLTIGIQ